MAGTEAAHLTGALDRSRTSFRWKADDLDAAGLQVGVGASALTLGGLPGSHWVRPGMPSAGTAATTSGSSPPPQAQRGPG